MFKDVEGFGRWAFTLAFGVALTSCTHVEWHGHYSQRYPAVERERVEIYRGLPPFDFQQVGELTLRPWYGDDCSENHIREKAREVAGKWGCNVVAFVDEKSQVSGASVIGGSVVVSRQITCRAIIGRRAPQ